MDDNTIHTGSKPATVDKPCDLENLLILLRLRVVIQLVEVLLPGSPLVDLEEPVGDVLLQE